jgi:hypothetical protein
MTRNCRFLLRRAGMSDFQKDTALYRSEFLTQSDLGGRHAIGEIEDLWKRMRSPRKRMLSAGPIRLPTPSMGLSPRFIRLYA